MKLSELDPNVVIWLVIAIINILPTTIAAVFAILSHSASRRTESSSSKNSEAIARTEALTKTVELATNSMKDQLVAATQLAGEAKGRDEERVRAKLADEERLIRGRASE
jgi:hypothetical protein